MASPFQQLRAKLSELFQLEAAAELDFGIYRILNSRRSEVVQFLDGLETEVNRVLDANPDPRTAALRDELTKVEAGLRLGGIGEEMIQSAPKVKELRAELAASAPTDPALLQHELFSHLTTFFSRYYKDGDFLSLRRYKGDTYAIPYQGEEVKLHWANADQYYIKSAENFRDYTFTLGSTQQGTENREPRTASPRVSFKLIQADTERDNTKAVAGQERRFIYHSVVSRTEDHLVLGFEYRPLTEAESGGPDKEGEEVETTGKKKKKKVTQATLNQDAVAAILQDCARAPFTGLAAPMPTEKNKTRTLLEKRLSDYTARNTFDYFIHKDLGGFLRRELDFYLKNEVLHLDDLEKAGQDIWDAARQKMLTLRAIAHRIIRFLAQIEDFQRKLWLKKKFVVGCDYVLTLDRIPESLYPEIAACEAQREEWVRLFGIEEITAEEGKVGYSIEFLKQNQGLVVDTRLLEACLRTKLLGMISRSERDDDSLLVNADNYQSLRQLACRFENSVKMTYIDPPYNTGGDGFLYRDSYQHSSWLSMIHQRLQIAQRITSPDGAIYCSIDAVERTQLEASLMLAYGKHNRVEEIIWAQNTTKNQSPTYSTNHEYVEVFAKDIEVVKKDFAMFRESKPGFREIMDSVAALNERYAATSEVEAALVDLFKEHRKKMRDDGVPEEDDPWKGIYNYRNAEYRGSKNNFVPENEAAELEAKLWVWREVDASMPQVKEDSQKEEFRDPESPTYRFYQPPHPYTQKPCPAPKRGWAWPRDPHGKQTSSFNELAADHRIAWGEDETKIPQRKSFLHEVETNVPKSVISDYTDGEKELTDLFGKTRTFSGPKPTTLINRFCLQATTANSFILDFFAGSGTTGHAVINLNREDGGSRKYILVEMGEHFDTVLVPRLKKVIYSKDWKEGKPMNRTTGISHCFKVLRLESYEDTLNNLRLNRSAAHEGALKLMDADQQDEYRLGYMLDVEAEGSASLLNISAFTDPWDYTLDIASGSAGETRPTKVDLVETYHWLIGLTVTSQRFVEAPKSRKKSAATPGPMLSISEGTNPAGERVLVIWRKQVLITSKALNDWLTEDGLAARLGEFTEVHVNGDHHLDLLRGKGQTWTARLIDDLFPKLMWEGVE